MITNQCPFCFFELFDRNNNLYHFEFLDCIECDKNFTILFNLETEYFSSISFQTSQFTVVFYNYPGFNYSFYYIDCNKTGQKILENCANLDLNFSNFNELENQIKTLITFS